MSNPRLEYHKKMIGKRVLVVQDQEIRTIWEGEVIDALENDRFLIKDDNGRDRDIHIFDVRSVNMSPLSL
jgi:hypothetical protein